jgi:hypothetical protein
MLFGKISLPAARPKPSVLLTVTAVPGPGVTMTRAEVPTNVESWVINGSFSIVD